MKPGEKVCPEFLLSWIPDCFAWLFLPKTIGEERDNGESQGATAATV